MTADEQTHWTRVFSGILGPYLVVAAITLLVRSGDWLDLIPAFMQNAPLVLVTGAFTLLAGLTIIRLHHHWNNALAAVISLIGIFAALKGAWLMIAPRAGLGATVSITKAPGALPLIAIALLLVGIWLTYSGWPPRTR
jgi:hypothetical protein